MRIATAEFGLVKSRPPGHSGNSVFSTSASSLNEGISVFQVRPPDGVAMIVGFEVAELEADHDFIAPGPYSVVGGPASKAPGFLWHDHVLYRFGALGRAEGSAQLRHDQYRSNHRFPPKPFPSTPGSQMVAAM